MQDNNSNPQKDNYFYLDGKKVSLQREPSIFTVKYHIGHHGKDGLLSPEGLRLLQEDAENIDFLAQYGIQVYRVQPLETSTLTAKQEGREEKLKKRVGRLQQERTIAFTAMAYKRVTGDAVNSVDELMFTNQQFVAKFKDSISPEQIAGLHKKYAVSVIRSLDYTDNAFVLQAPSGDGTQGPVQLANLYHESGMVEFAHPNFIRKIHYRSLGTSTARKTAIRALNTTYLDEQWHLERIRAFDAWKTSKGKASVKVAILDDGVDVDHLEFQGGKIVDQFDFSTNTSSGRPVSASDNHGTACAGVAVARGVKASGIAPDCSLIAIKTPNFLGTIEEAEMFKWVADRGASIISCSWGPPDGTGRNYPISDTVLAALKYCAEQGRGGHGIPIFWAAGNGNESVSQDGYAANEYVMAIAAVNDENKRAYYSDYGREIFLCAPSSGDSFAGRKGIFTVDRQGGVGYNPSTDPNWPDPSPDHNYTATFGGTSSATPLVAGVAALLLAVNEDLSLDELKNILASSAKKIDPIAGNYQNGHSHWYGYGMVDAAAAVAMAQTQSDSTKVGGQENNSNFMIVGPENIESEAAPPIFSINKGGRNYYAVEVATDSSLFHYDTNELFRTPDNFYAAWEDDWGTSPTYQLPQNVWNRLKYAERLYYRVHLTNDWNWNGYLISTEDKEHYRSPSCLITPSANWFNFDKPAADVVGTSQQIAYPSGEQFEIIENPTDGIDYSDHVNEGRVPLISTAGRRNVWLSENFQLREFLPRDQSAYARVSPALVTSLQQLRDRLGLAIVINSSYRHPAYNESRGGATNSQHISGQAIDMRVPGMSALNLARAVLEVFGCDIGIGLNRTSIHVDLRGRLASWAYPKAAMSEAAFDEWVLQQCADLGHERTLKRLVIPAPRPGIIAPEQYAVTSDPPVFSIQTAGNRLFAVEVATNVELLDIANEDQRTSENFFGSWQDGLLTPSLGKACYHLPSNIWDQLKNSPRLFYRLITCQDEEWSDARCSLGTNKSNAPWIKLIGHLTIKNMEQLIQPISQDNRRRKDEALWRKLNK